MGNKRLGSEGDLQLLAEFGASPGACRRTGGMEREETPEGHVIRYAPGTSRIVGLTMLSPRFILERDGRIVVTMPEAVEATADDLAPALAAV